MKRPVETFRRGNPPRRGQLSIGGCAEPDAHRRAGGYREVRYAAEVAELRVWGEA